ncbi:MAG TPA: hypothetical protein VK468_09030, partial [Pyrinomonadaceae bacterium]|nr:hypothetical protein [Pyrinomonadaceae bacterium]
MATRFFPIYNIDQPVGPGKANRADDVRLIQAIFIELARYSSTDWLKDIPQEQRGLATTGSFDNRLHLWITTLQNWAVGGYGKGHFKADGIIDPLPHTSSVSLGT